MLWCLPVYYLLHSDCFGVCLCTNWCTLNDLVFGPVVLWSSGHSFGVTHISFVSATAHQLLQSKPPANNLSCVGIRMPVLQLAFVCKSQKTARNVSAFDSLGSVYVPGILWFACNYCCLS